VMKLLEISSLAHNWDLNEVIRKGRLHHRPNTRNQGYGISCPLSRRNPGYLNHVYFRTVLHLKRVVEGHEPPCVPQQCSSRHGKPLKDYAMGCQATTQSGTSACTLLSVGTTSHSPPHLTSTSRVHPRTNRGQMLSPSDTQTRCLGGITPLPMVTVGIAYLTSRKADRMGVPENRQARQRREYDEKLVHKP